MEAERVRAEAASSSAAEARAALEDEVASLRRELDFGRSSEARAAAREQELGQERQAHEARETRLLSELTAASGAKTRSEESLAEVRTAVTYGYIRLHTVTYGYIRLHMVTREGLAEVRGARTGLSQDGLRARRGRRRERAMARHGGVRIPPWTMACDRDATATQGSHTASTRPARDLHVTCM